MRHTVTDLLDVVYRYFPRNMACRDPRYWYTEEHQRLVAARKQAGAEEAAWEATRHRVLERIKGGAVEDRSLFLRTGRVGSAYAGSVWWPEAEGRTLEFRVGFLVPCYIIYRARPPEPKVAEVSSSPVHVAYEGATMYAVSADKLAAMHETTPSAALIQRAIEEIARSEALSDEWIPRAVESFDFSDDELPIATAIAREIEVLWGHERMSPEVAKIVVPDVATNHRGIGETTLFDCLLSDDCDVPLPRTKAASM